MVRTLAFVLAVLLTARTASAASKPLPSLPALVKPGNRFTILLELLQLTKLLDTVVNTKDITVFAPTDSAFKRTARDLGCTVHTKRDAVNCLSGKLVKKGSLDLLKKVLTYHVVPGARTASRVLRARRLTTLQGAKFQPDKGLELIDLASGVPNPHLVLRLLDLKYNNGVVHAIDRVLLPLQSLLLESDACSAFERVVVTKLNAFVFLNRVEANALRCKSVRRAIRDCKRAPTCRNGIAWRRIVPGLTLGKVVSAVATCKPAARAIVMGC